MNAVAGAPGLPGPLASSISPLDLVRAGSVGLRSRRVRALLTAIAIAIGIAAMVAVLGISESSRSGLLAELDRLGTNLLTVSPGQTVFGAQATLPLSAEPMIRRIGSIQSTAATAPVPAHVYRSDRIPSVESGGLGVVAAETGLLTTVRASLAAGTFLNGATSAYPAVVLGADTATDLGIMTVFPPAEIWLGGHWFTVVGILDPVVLAPELDRTALIGVPIAESLFGIDGSAGTIYVRADPQQLNDVASLLAGTANPEAPGEVSVSRPSDILVARAAAASAFTSLFLALAAVALVVAGVGIANVMLMSVLERRSEIGLRRALGATEAHIALQFLVESLFLAGAGGLLGIVAGMGAAAAYATVQQWPIVAPVDATIGGLVAALAMGAVAGLYPAMRAARTSPTEALRSS